MFSHVSVIIFIVKVTFLINLDKFLAEFAAHHSCDLMKHDGMMNHVQSADHVDFNPPSDSTEHNDKCESSAMIISGGINVQSQRFPAESRRNRPSIYSQCDPEWIFKFAYLTGINISGWNEQKKDSSQLLPLPTANLIF